MEFLRGASPGTQCITAPLPIGRPEDLIASTGKNQSLGTISGNWLLSSSENPPKKASLPGQRGPAAPIDTMAKTSTELMYWPAIKSLRSKHQIRFSFKVRLTPKVFALLTSRPAKIHLSKAIPKPSQPPSSLQLKNRDSANIKISAYTLKSQTRARLFTTTQQLASSFWLIARSLVH